MLPVGLFVSCNIDSLLVLMLLFCTPLFSVRSIVIGQFLSQGILVLSSMAIAALAYRVSAYSVSLVGLVPLTLGIAKLVEQYRQKARERDDSGEKTNSLHSSIGAITLLMLSTGGDNLSVYVPLFRMNPLPTVIYFCTVFFLMTCAWCLLSYYLARHPLVGKVVARYSERLLPWNMIGLGIYVLSGPMRLLLRH